MNLPNIKEKIAAKQTGPDFTRRKVSVTQTRRYTKVLIVNEQALEYFPPLFDSAPPYGLIVNEQALEYFTFFDSPPYRVALSSPQRWARL